jgi:hypothetical protein
MCERYFQEIFDGVHSRIHRDKDSVLSSSSAKAILVGELFVAVILTKNCSDDRQLMSLTVESNLPMWS